MYKADSKIAEEFIDHQEILDTLEYAHNNKSNRALIEQLIDKAAKFKDIRSGYFINEYVILQWGSVQRCKRISSANTAGRTRENYRIAYIGNLFLNDKRVFYCVKHYEMTAQFDTIPDMPSKIV